MKEMQSTQPACVAACRVASSATFRATKLGDVNTPHSRAVISILARSQGKSVQQMPPDVWCYVVAPESGLGPYWESLVTDVLSTVLPLWAAHTQKLHANANLAREEGGRGVSLGRVLESEPTVLRHILSSTDLVALRPHLRRAVSVAVRNRNRIDYPRLAADLVSMYSGGKDQVARQWITDATKNLNKIEEGTD